MSAIQPKNTPTQPTTPAASAPKPTHQDKPKPKPKPKKEARLQPVQPYTGTVGAYAANPDGIYDKFALATANKTYTVKFPPHFGQALQALAQPGHTVTVLGFVKTTPKGDEHLHLASITAGAASARPLPPASAAETASVAGTIAELHHDSQGRLHGLRLSGEAAALRLPPHLGQQLAGRLGLGTALVASGQRRALRPGEVAAPDHLAPLHLELLTLGEDSFLLH